MIILESGDTLFFDMQIFLVCRTLGYWLISHSSIAAIEKLQIRTKTQIEEIVNLKRALDLQETLWMTSHNSLELTVSDLEIGDILGPNMPLIVQIAHYVALVLKRLQGLDMPSHSHAPAHFLCSDHSSAGQRA